MYVLSCGCSELASTAQGTLLCVTSTREGHQCMESSFQPDQRGGTVWFWTKLDGDFSLVQEYLSILQWNLVALLWSRCSSCKGLC